MPTAPTLTLDQLVALNDEIVALSRAGVPLEPGLARLGSASGARVGRFAEQLSERMARGESLAQLVADSHNGLPPLYRAVLAAGVRSGSLSEALQSLSDTARRVAELRRLARSAWAYPLVVLAVAYCLFLFSLVNIVPALASAYDAWELPRGIVVSLMMSLHDTLASWWFVPPLLLLIYLIWEWTLATRLTSATPWAWCSPFARLQRNRRLATFAETLALLISQHVPLGEGVLLAAGAAGDRRLQSAASIMAEQLARGDRTPVPGFPPLLGLLLVNASQPSELERALRRAAADYEARARRAVEWFTYYLPAMLTVGIGGTVVLLQTLSLFGPWLHLLRHLALP